MYYTQFLNIEKSGELIEPCGSDSVFILDGRNNIETMIIDSIERANKLKNISKFDGFKIMKGERFSNSNAISSIVRL